MGGEKVCFTSIYVVRSMLGLGTVTHFDTVKGTHTDRKLTQSSFLYALNETALMLLQAVPLCPGSDKQIGSIR